MKYGLEIRNQNSGEPPLLSRLPVQISVSAPSVQGQGGWLVDDDISRGPLKNRPLGPLPESDALKSDKQRGYQNSYPYTTLGSTSSGLLSQTSEVKGEEVCSEFSSTLLFWNVC